MIRRPPRSTLFPYTRSSDLGRVDVHDLDSRHGTFVDGARVNGSRRLRGGEVVRLGDTVLLTALERSEEHTSELQSLRHLVCRLLLEKKNNNEQQYSEAELPR